MDIAIYQGFNFRAEDGTQTRDPQLGRTSNGFYLPVFQRLINL